MKLCAIIPAHNEEAAIPGVVRGALEHCEQVVVVDDGSADGTSHAAREAGAVVLLLPRKSGKGTALRAGFSHALRNGFDAVVTIDADGQHPPSEIPRFVRTAEQNGAALVTGSRMANAGGMPFLRWLTNWLTSKALSVVFGYELRDTQCGYRLIRTDLLRRLPLQARKYDIETEILVEAHALGVKACEIPLHCLYLRSGHTHDYQDYVRYLRVYGRRFSRWRGIFRLAKFAAQKTARPLTTFLKYLAFPLLLLAGYFVFREATGGRITDPRALRTTLEGAGLLAPLVFLAVCTAKPLTFLPSAGLTLVGATLFGLWKGALLLAIGGLTSAMVGFSFARLYGRTFVERHLEGRFPRLREWLASAGWGTILFLRLLSLPWDYVSYAAGLSRIRFRDFMLGTLIPVVPLALMGAYFADSIWTFPSPQFFLAGGLIFAFGTAAWLARRRYRLSRGS